ncbi:MAG: exodeoxyribonuclease V subunit gamma, partial [Clostridia bacterium]|nr:exodeoxyribonuclease V subunit gamma [Clostridia bacterium]
MLHLVFAKRSGGKTTFCLNQLKAAYDSNQKAALLIPEQLSLSMEDKVIDTVGFVGNNIEVFSFLRLFRRVYAQLNRPKREYMDEVGKTMLINRILETGEKDFLIFKPGKAANSGLLSAVTEFKRHFADAENLEKASELFESSMSKQKFKEFSLLLSRYNDALSNSNADSSDNLSLLPELIENSNYLEGFTFYIDGFDGFTPQETAVISALAQKCEIYVTLTFDKSRPILFEPIVKTVTRLKKAAEDNNIEVSEEYIPDKESTLPKSLLHLRESYANYSAHPFDGKVESIQIVSADTPYGEAEACARRILKLIKNGMRLRDIVVLVPDTESYVPVLDKIFSDFSLPYFADKREIVSTHP